MTAKNPFTNNSFMLLALLACAALICSCFLGAGKAEAAELTAAKIKLPPNATEIVKYNDGNYYAIYKGNVCALTKIKRHAKSIVVPKFIKVGNKRYKVVAIHELGLSKRTDVKKVTIKATNMETVEEPALFKDWRDSHHKKLKVKITDKTMRKWLNAKW